MTAIKNIELPSGVIVEDAIHRIESVSINYKNKASYLARVYKQLDKPFFHEFSGEFDYQGGDILKEAYLKLNVSGNYREN